MTTMAVAMASPRLIVCGLGIAFLMSTAFAAGPMQGLDAIVEKAKAASGLPSGTAVAVVKDGKVIYEGYFGYADIGAKVPVQRDTVFYIASTTKPFVALHSLLKAEAGQLDTKATLQQLFPKAEFKGVDAREVTLRHLLTHTSGLRNDALVWATAFSGLHNAGTRTSLVAQSLADAEAPLGTFAYTNLGYNILSVWLDQRFDQPWQSQLDASIFAPLGMAHTTAYISKAKANRWQLAEPYSYANAEPSAPLYLRKVDATMQAAGGLVSSAPDLARFLIAELEGGRLDGTQRLPAAVLARSQQVQARTTARYDEFERSGYAWGWYEGGYKGQRMLHHFGGFAGFHAHLSYMPEQHVGLVVLNNEDVLSGKLTGLIADYVYGELLGDVATPARVNGRLDKLLAQLPPMREGMAKQRQKIAARAVVLSLPPASYVGRYFNEQLGEVVVRLNDDKHFEISTGQLRALASGFDQEDKLRVEFVPNSGVIVQFAKKDGHVEALEFSDMRYVKIAE